jgi:hypothetical protein
VEARHNAYLRGASKARPFPQPFDVPLDFNEVYSLASPFIVSCPSSNPAFLPLKAFPALTLTSNGTVLAGQNITVLPKTPLPSGPIYAAFISITGPVFTPISLWGGGQYEVVVPKGISGQSYLVITKNSTAATDDTVLAGPTIVEVAGSNGVPGSP